MAKIRRSEETCGSFSYDESIGFKYIFYFVLSLSRGLTLWKGIWTRQISPAILVFSQHPLWYTQVTNLCDGWWPWRNHIADPCGRDERGTSETCSHKRYRQPYGVYHGVVFLISGSNPLSDYLYSFERVSYFR